MTTYLVTGTAGFIASRVATLLLEEGHRVIGLDNLNDAYDVLIKQWRLNQLVKYPEFFFHPVDICDKSSLQIFFTQLDDEKNTPAAVINLAARAGVRASVANPWIYFETNMMGTLNLLELCRTHQIPKFVLASSSSLYGNQNSIPFAEDANTDYPVSPYAASKKAAEVLCAVYHELHGIDTTIFRYFTVYGPAGRPDMSPLRFTQWISEGHPLMIFGDGQQSRDFTYVDDIARGTIAGLKMLGYEIINLGSNNPVVLMDMVHMLEELIGKQANLVYRPQHPSDMPTTWANTQKAHDILGWEPQVTLPDGLKQLVGWYNQNRSWVSQIVTLTT